MTLAPTRDGFVEFVVAAMREAVAQTEVLTRSLPVLARWRTRMRLRGTAGRCIAWWSEIAEANPDATPEELVEAFAERCDAEIERAPRFYTAAHMQHMIWIAGTVAENTNLRRRPYGYSSADPALAAALDARYDECVRWGVENEPTWRDEVQFVAGWNARGLVRA